MRTTADEIRDLIFELALEPEDLFERPHPELRSGEVLIGLMEYTAGHEGKEYEAFTSPTCVEPFTSRRLGEKEQAKSIRSDGWTPYDYHRPVFVSQEEWDAYIKNFKAA